MTVIKALLTPEIPVPIGTAEAPPTLGKLTAHRTVLGAEQPASTDDPVHVKAGDVLHGIIPEAQLLCGYALARGDELLLTAELIENSKNRNGDSPLDDLSDSAQIRRWGEVRLGVGPWPRDAHGAKLPSWLHGDPVWAEQREKARRLAWAEPDEAIRQQKLAKLREVYGESLPTSKTLNAKVW